MIQPFKTKPDFEHLRRVLMRETMDGPIPLIELFADSEILLQVTGSDLTMEQINRMLNNTTNLTDELMGYAIKYLDMIVDYSVMMGYDFAYTQMIVPLNPSKLDVANDPNKSNERQWHDLHHTVIQNRSDYERYPWPSPDEVNLLPIDYIASRIPDGMKICAWTKGIFELTTEFLGFENMAYKSFEEPSLIADILDRITDVVESAIEKSAAHPAVGMIFLGEDMGFKTGTFMSPKFMREIVFPRLKRVVDAAHRHNKPFLLHSCGQIYSLMDDLIDYVGIDGKHSFEDTIKPVEEVYPLYYKRVTILGGMPIDLLARGTEQEVRERTRRMLQVCSKGGFCMGTGNSVANYVKLENFLAMIDETRIWNEKNGWR